MAEERSETTESGSITEEVEKKDANETKAEEQPKEADSVKKFSLENCSAIVVDVAGTTTPMKFVVKTLNDFVINHVYDFLKENWEDETVKMAMVNIGEEGETLDQKSASERIIELTNEDSNDVVLLVLQCLVIKRGYENGDLKTPIFDDVPPCLETWSKSRKVVIYSTCSTESQKLLFTNTSHGDLTPHLSEYFDQGIGLKKESVTYEKIVEKLKLKPEEVIYITDSVEEAQAAKSVNVTPILISREGNEPFPVDISKDFMVITSFKDLSFENAQKRKMEDEPSTSTEVRACKRIRKPENQ